MSTPHTSTHPGIIIIPPTQKRPYYALRYRDPVTQSERQQRQSNCETPEQALEAAQRLHATLSALSATPSAERPSPRVRAKPDSARRGVTIIFPTAKRPHYSLRYRDPVSGKIKQPKLPGVLTEEAAKHAAKKRAESLRDQKQEIVLAGGREYAGTVGTLRDEIKTYLATVKRKVSRRGKPTSAVTLRRYKDGLNAFADWLEALGVVQLRQVSRVRLSEWLASRQSAPAHGRERKVSTVNQEVKPIRQMLVGAALAGRMTHLSSDAVRGVLKRLVQPAPEPVCYSVVQIAAVLQAALDFDVDAHRPRHAPPLAPIVAVALLTGMRRRELATLQVREVLFNAASDYDPAVKTGLDVLRIPDAKSKTGVGRDVLMAPYSPMLGELMQALTLGRPGQERVLRVGYVALGDYAKRLRKWGAPAGFMFKSLRSTCATYQSPLPGNPKAKADRQGHTLQVAEQHYLKLPTGTPLTAPDLETVMKCESLLREVIERVLAPKLAPKRAA